jgi:acetoin utilization deacetylase AcuC-like enzyme
MIPVIFSEEFLQHDTGKFHPERPERLTAIVESLHQVQWRNQIQWLEPTPLTERNVLTWLQKVHSQDHIERVKEISVKGGGGLDLDTPVSSRSYDIALLAVSAWLDGVDLVLNTNKPAFVLARPPGHHATKTTGMGFCLFSNAAIAAEYALSKEGVEKVAILDWDVHHGNGTEAIIEHNPQIIYCSLHQYPCYPGTGRATDHGLYKNVLNIPMSAGSTIREYQRMFEQKVIPFISNFQPDLLIVSAGYDANHDDPLAGISLFPQDFGIFTDYCLEITPKVLLGLEGGYDLKALSESVKSTIYSCIKHFNLIIVYDK